MKHGKTPTAVGAAGRGVLVAVTLFSFLAGILPAGAVQEEGKETPGNNAGSELFTHVYVVPPTFGQSRDDAGEDDPFGDPGAEARPSSRRPARELLESYGISFGEGASAVFHPSNSQLIVRQTRDQMEMVEAVIETLRENIEFQVYLTYQLVESEKRLLEKSMDEPEQARQPPADPDSGARLAGRDPILPTSVIPALHLEGSTVFSSEGLEGFLDEVRQNEQGRIRRSPSLLARSGKRGELWVADALVEVDPVIGADNRVIDLNLVLKAGRSGEKPTGLSRRQVTLQAGQTVAFEERLEDGTFRTRLLTVEIVDPAGVRVEDPAPSLEIGTFPVPGFPDDAPLSREAHDVRKLLQKRGIEFGEGTRAIYHPATEVLLVRNTPDHLAAVEELAREWAYPPNKQVYFTVREALLEGVDAHLDWMLLERPDDATAEIGKAEAEPQNRKAGIAGVFTDPQFQVLIRAWNQRKGVTLTSAPSVLASSGQACQIEIGDRRWELQGIVGGDEFTVEVEFRLHEPGKERDGDRGSSERPGFDVVIWDGQTIAFTQPADEAGKTRVAFITAQLVDPAPQENGENDGSEAEAEQDRRDLRASLTRDQQDAIKMADERAERAARLMGRGQEEEEVENLLIESLRLLPFHPLTEDRRKAYAKQLELHWQTMGRTKVPGPTTEPRVPRPESTLFPAPAGGGTDDHHAAFEIGADERLVVHEVALGETLYSLARRYGTSPSRLRLINRLSVEIIEVGERLIVPEKTGSRSVIRDVELPSWKKPEEETSVASRKAAAIILPRVEFRELPLGDALQFLQRASLEFDQESPANRKGFDIIATEAESFIDTPITLDLTNVPWIEALRYTLLLANARFEFEGESTVLVGPESRAKAEPERAKREESVPEDLWFRAYLLLKEGEEAEEREESVKALDALGKAEELLGELERKFPDYHPEIIKYRRNDILRRLEGLRKGEPDQ